MDNSNLIQLPPILSIRDLMTRLNLSSTDLSMLEKDGSFPFVSLGNQRFVLRDSLLEWMKTHERSRSEKGGRSAWKDRRKGN